MKEEKLLSIIVPTYNMERYLSRCLDSLLVSSIIVFITIEQPKLIRNIRV